MKKMNIFFITIFLVLSLFFLYFSKVRKIDNLQLPTEKDISTEKRLANEKVLNSLEEKLKHETTLNLELQQSILQLKNLNSELSKKNKFLKEKLVEFQKLLNKMEKEKLEQKDLSNKISSQKNVDTNNEMASRPLPLSTYYPKASSLKGPSLSKDPEFFRILLLSSLTKEQKCQIVDLISEYKVMEEDILTRPRNPVVGEEIMAELEDHLINFEQKSLNNVSCG